MSELNITEYQSMSRDSSGNVVQVGKEPNLVIQNVSYTTTSVQSSAFNPKTSFLRIVADADSRVEFGANPTASANSMTLPAGSVEYIGIPKGQDYKVAVIQL